MSYTNDPYHPDYQEREAEQARRDRGEAPYIIPSGRAIRQHDLFIRVCQEAVKWWEVEHFDCPRDSEPEFIRLAREALKNS